jgi:hypothetical protein
MMQATSRSSMSISSRRQEVSKDGGINIGIATLRPLSMLVIKKARSNNIKERLNAIDIDDRSGKGGVLVATMTHEN